MQNHHQIGIHYEKQLIQTFNQIELINHYQTQTNQIAKVQILSRLKKILLTIPNQIQVDPIYLKESNDKYFCFLLQQITFKSANPYFGDSLTFLFHVVSLRIKLWFNKKEFDDIFNSFMINIEHNKKIIPNVIDFLIQLIDVFQNTNHTKNESTQNKQLFKCYLNNSSRLSLTRKTNSQFFADEIPNKKTLNATKQLNRSMNKKNSYTKQNRFQRQFLDFQLNKILLFANQVFSRAVVQNQRYNMQEQIQQQQQHPYIIKMPVINIIKDLQLIHKILVFDFFSQRNNTEFGIFFNQKLPLIIPTKYSKLCQFYQFQNWIRNKKDICKYQYLYFYSNQPQLKIVIVNIFGDLLRIHQKFFKKELFFKNHLEAVILPLKSMIQNLQIRYNNDFQLAIVFGQNINKLLLSSTFPTFLNLIKSQFKTELIETLDLFIHKEIFERKLMDVTLIKYFIGFFIDLCEKLSYNSSDHFRIKDFKEQVEVVIKRIGVFYQQILYLESYDYDIKEDFQNIQSLQLAVQQLNLVYFETYFAIFKFHAPKKTFNQCSNVKQKCLYVCSKLQNSLFQYELLSKNLSHDKNHLKFDLANSYALQSFQKLTEFLLSQKNNQLPLEKRRSYQNSLRDIKLKLLTVSFFLQKLFDSASGTLLIFDQGDSVFSFTKAVIQLVFQTKSFYNQQNKDQGKRHEINNCVILAQQILSCLLKLNKIFLKAQQKRKQFKNQTNNQVQKRASFIFSDLKNQKMDQKMSVINPECQRFQKQLNYFEQLLNIINNFFSQDLYEDSLNSPFHYLAVLHKSVKNRQNKQIIEILYGFYFNSLQKYETHIKQHTQVFLQFSKPNSSYKFETSQQNEDECSVIEQNDLILSDLPKCCKYFEERNSLSLMNPISYYVFMKQIDQNDSLLGQLANNFKTWFYKCQNNQNDINNDLSQEPINQIQGYGIDSIKYTTNKKKRQEISNNISKLYNIQNVVQILINDFQIVEISRQHQLKRQLEQYLLKTCSLILKLFRNLKFQTQMRIEVIDCMFDFIIKSFTQVYSQGYTLNSQSGNEPQDQQMAIKVQAMVSLLQSLIKVVFQKQRLNIFNQEFLILFPNFTQQIIEIPLQERKLIYQKFHRNRDISQVLIKCVDFILGFPQNYLLEGYFSGIQYQLIRLIRQLYFQFSHFNSIYMLNHLNSDSLNQKIFQNQICKVSVYQNDFSQEKIAILVDSNNFESIIKGYVVLIQYIQKVFRMSFISTNQQWQQFRNKDFLSYINQIRYFIQKLKENPSLMNKAFGKILLSQVQQIRSSNKILDSIKKMVDTMFVFINYFLTNFQNQTVYFITKHLSLVESIYKLVSLAHQLDVAELRELIAESIQQTNKIVIFKNIPVQKRSYTLRVSHLRNKSKAKMEQSSKPFAIQQYRGWKYIERLSLQEEDQILDQLQQYELKFKYYLVYNPETFSQKEYSSENLQMTEYSEQMQNKINRSIIQSIRKSQKSLKSNKSPKIQYTEENNNHDQAQFFDQNFDQHYDFNFYNNNLQNEYQGENEEQHDNEQQDNKKVQIQEPVFQSDYQRGQMQLLNNNNNYNGEFHSKTQNAFIKKQIQQQSNQLKSSSNAQGNQGQLFNPQNNQNLQTILSEGRTTPSSCNTLIRIINQKYTQPVSLNYVQQSQTNNRLSNQQIQYNHQNDKGIQLAQFQNDILCQNDIQCQDDISIFKQQNGDQPKQYDILNHNTSSTKSIAPNNSLSKIQEESQLQSQSQQSQFQYLYSQQHRASPKTPEKTKPSSRDDFELRK